jgi:hypothetical protein
MNENIRCDIHPPPLLVLMPIYPADVRYVKMTKIEVWKTLFEMLVARVVFAHKNALKVT